MLGMNQPKLCGKTSKKKHSLWFHWARLKIASLVFPQQDSLQRLGQLLAISKAESAQKGDQIDPLIRLLAFHGFHLASARNWGVACVALFDTLEVKEGEVEGWVKQRLHAAPIHNSHGSDRSALVVGSLLDTSLHCRVA